MDWENQSTDSSFGHDIEASWLAVGPDGGLAYERTKERGLVADRCWWPQAEALIGFYNAYQLTGDISFEGAAKGVWRFIKDTIIDHTHGEWFWRSSADAPDRGPYKAGFWKGPYHNGRAMMEMARRLGQAQ